VIPDIFCWTKMGAEAGQGLDSILYRKELERMAGNGSFAWGIGNSLGNSAKLAIQQSKTGEVDVLFTPMKSAPKFADTNPSHLFLWMYYEDASGAVVELPEHILITSRGSEGKRTHYALLCHSTDKIEASDLGGFNSTNVRNFISMNPVGASQVTSVVRYQTIDNDDKPYRVSFKAKLHGEGFVKLVNPISINQSLMQMYNEACASETPSDWFNAVANLKQSVRDGFELVTSQMRMFA